MSDDSRVQQLIEEVLVSERSVEAVCNAAPELLAQVREGVRKVREVQAQVSALFPEAGAVDVDGTMPLFPEGLPEVPGYDVTEELGRGGVGVVYKARHLRLNRPVALKMLLAGACASRAERQRLAREAELVAELRHPNIVQVHDVGDLDGRPYFTMEFVEGGSLDRKLAGKPLPAFLAGTYQPADPCERLAFVGAGAFNGLTCASARLYADAFATEPSLANDPERGRRYRAACMAASAGCGRGKDASNLNDEERAGLRDQARLWLRAEVAAWGKKIDSAPAAKESAENALKRWLTDPDLAGLREPDLLDKLPVAESRACRELWREISTQIERAKRRN